MFPGDMDHQKPAKVRYLGPVFAWVPAWLPSRNEAWNQGIGKLKPYLTIRYGPVWLSWMKPYYEIRYYNRCRCFFTGSQIGFTCVFFSKALKSGCLKQPLDWSLKADPSQSPGGKGQTLHVWSRQRIHKPYSRTVFTLRAFTGINQPQKNP